MDWNTLPAWCRFAVCYLTCCGLLTMLFGAEWVLLWWEARERKRLDDNPFDIGEYSALEEARWKDRS